MSTGTLAVPQDVQETGVPRTLLEGLALKILYLSGELSLRELAERMRLSMAAVDEVFQFLRKEQLCEVKGMAGGVHRIVASGQGKARAAELLSLNQYVGSAPVSLADYVTRIRAQSVRDVEVRPSDVERAFGSLVMTPDALVRLGTAIVSGTSIFLYGPTGTGKTSVAEMIPNVYGDAVWIPYAVEVDHQIIAVYDSHVHQALDPLSSDDMDRRWVLCRRPRVIAGGELTFEMLDLQFNPATRFYTAPLQMKANNGVLIIDDFGRQRIRPDELLNRWILPLDRRVDFLSLAGGKKFEIPFDLFVVFATNLNPAELADEAFLRRIQNKIKMDYVTREQFQEIFRRLCCQFELSYDAAVVDHLIDVMLKGLNQPLRSCYPRDIVQQICWSARYRGGRPQLDQKTVEQACRNYFLPRESV